MHTVARLALVLALAALLAPAASGGGLTILTRSGTEALAEGELYRLSLQADGVVRTGPAFESVDLESETAWCALTTGGALWIGTGNQGDILRVGTGGTVTRIATDEALLVTALAPLGGDVAAALFPGGRLLRVKADGATEGFATLPVEHVWSLAEDGRGGLYVATGVPGALFHVDAFGAATKVADVGDDHARCLTAHGDTWLVGTCPKGRVLEIRNGQVTVLRDLDAQEIVGVLPLESGGLLVAANADESGGNAQTLAGLLNRMVKPQETRPGQQPPPRQALQDGRVLWLEPSGAVTTLWAEAKVAALTLGRDGAGAAVGTYPAGRLVHVAPRQPWSLVADLPQAEASVVLGDATGISAVVTSNPAFLHRRAEAAEAGTWTSKPLDAGARANWGRVRVVGRGVEALDVRSGETEEPDETWTDWRKLADFDGTGGRAGARARFLQVRVALAGPEAEFRALEAVAAIPNRTPVVSGFGIERQGVKAGELPTAPDPRRQVSWKAEDPDGDALRVRLHARRLGSPLWIPLVEDEVLEKPLYVWDTMGIPDGLYQLRLVVSDAAETAPDAAREAEHVTAPFRVDNTAPRVVVDATVAGNGLEISGEAVDQAGGRIALVRVSVDGGPWRVLAATDGILDSAAEAFGGRLPNPAGGSHDVVVQARDADGNVGAAATVVRGD